MDARTLDPLIGRTVDDRYEVVSRIARGGQATVYRAVDRRLDRVVAVKVMHPHLAESPEFVARFRREARAAARLAHPGVVAVHDQGTAGEASYLAMEYVDGPTLRGVLDTRGSLALGEALQLTAEILDALACAHRSGVVHRDVKPENVLIGSDGRAKVADFGLARAVSEATAASTGTVLGTVAYLAPEVVTRGDAGPPADVYACGVLLYELLTGVQPFTGDAPIQVAYQHVNERVPPPSDRESWVPPEVDALVARLTAHDPGARPTDAGAALEAVRRCRDALAPGDLERRARRTPTTGPDGRGAGNDTDVVDAHVEGHSTLAVPIGAISPQAPRAAAARRRRRWPARLLALLLLLLALSVAAWAWWTQIGPGSQVRTPAVAGMSESAALAELESAGLEPEVTRSHDDDVRAGRVIGTEPTGGAWTRRGGTVTVDVSLGILVRTVPELVGEPAPNAEDLLGAAGLAVGATMPEYHDSEPEGTVLATTPSAGESVPHTTRVDLVVSAGREPVDTPDVAGQPLAAAVERIEVAGLEVGSTAEEHSAEVPEGTVVRQEPTADEGGQYRGDEVALVISIGPELVEVPGVVGAQVRSARDALEDAGLGVEVEEVLGGFFGTVRSQDPEAGAVVPRGTRITLTVV